VAVNRVVLIVLMLLGLSVAACGGVEQAGLGRSILLVHRASVDAGSGPGAAGLAEAETALAGCSWLTVMSTYLGLAIVCVAAGGLYLQGRAGRGNARP
jgi:hypothetical protein